LHPAADLQSALVGAWFLPLETFPLRIDYRSCERVFVTNDKTCSQECEHGTQECVRHRATIVAMRLLSAILLASIASAQTPELVTVVEKQVTRQVKLPGEFLPYETVELRARVAGFVDKVLVDRGSVVKKGRPCSSWSRPR
jgi:hypothetical protein